MIKRNLHAQHNIKLKSMLQETKLHKQLISKIILIAEERNNKTYTKNYVCRGGLPANKVMLLLIKHDHTQRNKTFIKIKGNVTEFPD